MKNSFNVLIVDDEEQMRLAMEAVLARLGYSISKAENGKLALELIESNHYDLVVSDMKMPVMGGLELLENIRNNYPKLPVVIITAYGTIEQAVKAMQNGAFDFITKPFSAEDLERVTKKAFSKPVKLKSKEVSSSKSSSVKSTAMITKDEGFKRVLEIAVAVSRSISSVLIQGESGTGKELISKFIHASSDRAKEPFVAVNCAALPDNLLESELFGHEKGAFTGAVGTKIGKFELANNGTILLDEISEMDLNLQAKLLRVLQEREVDRVGGSSPVPIDVRVIATTNRDLAEYVKEGKFREDLYYRLNVIPLFIPPLRERRRDIKLLLEHFIRRYSNGKYEKLNEDLLKDLENYNWPGNIRELQNASQRAVVLANGEDLKIDHFMLGSLSLVRKKEENLDSSLKLFAGLSVYEAEKRLIFETLKSTNNNKTKAAELLGISIRTLRNKLNEYDKGLNIDT